MPEELNKPESLNQEFILDPTREIMSKTDGDGIIEFVNDYFVEVSGYEEYELLGKTMHCTQHPNMPNIIFKQIWERLLAKQNFNVLVKNLAKDGRYYWAISDFAFKEDSQGNIVAIYNRRKIATPQAIRYFENLYKKLKSIETESGYTYAEKYLIGHEEEKGKNIEEILYDFQSNLNAPTKIKEKPAFIKEPKLKKLETYNKEETIIDLTEDFTTNTQPEKPTEDLSIKERLARLKNIHEKTLEALDVKPITMAESNNTNLDTVSPESVENNSPIEEENKISKDKQKKKKGIFQKLFGKTEEELEEEKRRNKQ